MSDLIKALKTISKRRLVDESKKLTELNKIDTTEKFFQSDSWKEIIEGDKTEKKTIAHSLAINYLKSVFGEDGFAFVDTENQQIVCLKTKKLVTLYDKAGIIAKLSPTALSILKKYEFNNFDQRNNEVSEVSGASFQGEIGPAEEQASTALDNSNYYSNTGSGYVVKIPGVTTTLVSNSLIDNKISFVSSYKTKNSSVGQIVKYNSYHVYNFLVNIDNREQQNFYFYHDGKYGDGNPSVLVIPQTTVPLSGTFTFSTTYDYNGSSVYYLDDSGENFVTFTGNQLTVSLENFTSAGGNLFVDDNNTIPV